MIVDARSLRKVLGSAGGGWCLTCAVGFTLFAAAGAAVLTAEQQGMWRIVWLVLINLFVQPICGLMVFGGCHTSVAAWRGRVTYALHTISPEQFPPGEHQRGLRRRLLAGLACATFSAALGFLSISPLFW
jgi:hypothetical protein